MIPIKKLRQMISIPIIVMILFSNMIMICSEDNGHIREVHSILETCDLHNCHKDHFSDSCEKDICEHQVCNDLALIDVFHIVQNFRLLNFTGHNTVCLSRFFSFDNLSISQPANIYIPNLQSNGTPVMMVLRI